MHNQQRDGVIFQLILNGYQPVETFFCLSGIVLSFRLFPAILRGKDLSAKTFLKDFAISLLRRVIRLLPSIFAVATFSATLLRFLGFGPRSSVLDKYQEIIAGIHQWKCSSFSLCHLFFLPRIYNKLSGYLWLFFLTVMSQAIPVIVMTINEFPPVSFPYISYC
ncbi:hypothetical protein Anas_07424 [Armadillidium nasatum]|uniref:Acyltransferase 3 domain-containing protein n=1 Tax=Armadillidium nasatum TaxID=96803 RepID=A0A5N5STD8_9CRUS|nr:hypothetical protein Anas_07424 [Armadillidium nasatum]